MAAARSHTTTGTGGAAGPSACAVRLEHRGGTDLLLLASQAHVWETLGAWKLQTPEEKNMSP